MRKFLSIALSFLLFLFSTGLAVNVHYCNDNLVDIAFFSDRASCCCSDAEFEVVAADCCYDGVFQIAITEDLAPSKDSAIPKFAVDIAPQVKPVAPQVLLPLPVPSFEHFTEVDLPPEDRVLRFRKLLFYA